MKILKLKTTTGFKMLEKDFEINFMTKTRIDRESNNDDLLELETDFFYPIETAFIGKNSSGKTSTLELITIALDFLSDGRISKEHLEFNVPFSMEIIFYNNGLLYKYLGSFVYETLTDKLFATITNEELSKTSLKESYRKDLSNASFSKNVNFEPNNGGDTSNITKFSNDGSFSFFANDLTGSTNNFGAFYRILGPEKFDAILKLFDDSIDYIKPLDGNNAIKNGYTFKRVGSCKPVIIEYRALDKMLSKGTIKGVGLYSLAIITFEKGGHLIVDEIESSFNRNLVENLFLMYNDKSINKRGGTIVYSTHYSELLDSNARCDNVNVLHRNGTKINIKNMCTDYKVRTEMVKSNQFNQNTFDTLINYEQLMKLKEIIRKQ